MDWISFSLGFVAFPVVAVAALGIYFGIARAVQRDTRHSRWAVDQRSSSLGFSPRLIGEIGEIGVDAALESALPDSEPAAKAS